MNDRSDALNSLRRTLADNNATFREGQWEAIDALVNKTLMEVLTWATRCPGTGISTA
jgi:predicted YcjX-like family ATPase